MSGPPVSEQLGDTPEPAAGTASRGPEFTPESCLHPEPGVHGSTDPSPLARTAVRQTSDPPYLSFPHPFPVPRRPKLLAKPHPSIEKRIREQKKREKREEKARRKAERETSTGTGGIVIYERPREPDEIGLPPESSR